MSDQTKTSAVLLSLALVFLGLAVTFGRHQGVPAPPLDIPLVDPALVAPSTIRTSYLQLIQMKADLSDFDCYACHEKGKPPTLRFDTNHYIIVPKEHSDVVMAHGRHNRNNNCFNCHDERNLLVLQTRDGRELKLEESPGLCGSCHGPTYRDWEAGAHGRTGGFWKKEAGELKRQICVDCHNPHNPKIPPRKPLPGPNPLRTPNSEILPQTGTKEARNPKPETRTSAALGAFGRRSRSAGFQPAVSQISNLLALGIGEGVGDSGPPADWKSAIQQVGSLRYDGSIQTRPMDTAPPAGVSALGLRISDFGFRISAFFRTSDFGFRTSAS